MHNKEKYNIGYEIVKEIVAADSRIGPSHLGVLRDSHRGYGGHCFPKDTKSFIDFSKGIGLPLKLLEKVDEINGQLVNPPPKILVSVIITTFSRPKYLKESVQSVLSQDFNELEEISIGLECFRLRGRASIFC